MLLFRGTINIFLTGTQFGFCCVFFVFFGENLKQVNTADHKQICLHLPVCYIKVFDACGLELPVRIWIVIMLPCSLRSGIWMHWHRCHLLATLALGLVWCPSCITSPTRWLKRRPLCLMTMKFKQPFCP